MTDSSPASTMAGGQAHVSSDGCSSPLSSPPSSMPSTPSSLGPKFPKFRMNEGIIEVFPEGNSNVEEAIEDLENILKPPPQLLGKRKSLPEESEEPGEPVVRAVTKPTKGYYGSKQEGKPKPYGMAPIWAEKRQQLCQVLKWFKAYQSGAYTNGGIAYGFLCDKEVGDRDYFGDQIMIARVGGGKKPNGSGKSVQVKSQDDCTLAMAFMKSKELRKPIGVIAGQGNTGSPTKLPHYYNVLGWFHVTDVWCERFNELNCWMVRLEKVDLTEKSWWSRADTPHSPPDFDSPKALVRTCNSCGKESKMIYKQGWACLNADPEPTKKGNKTREKRTCTEFFKFGEGINITNLEYTEEFLKERSSFKVLREQANLDPNPGPLGPPLLTEDDVERLGEFGFEEECKRGIVCPKCGCCSRRVNWGKWVCESSTSGGHFTYALRPRIIPAERAISEGNEVPLLTKEEGDEEPNHFVHPMITRKPIFMGGRKGFVYIFHGAKGPNGEKGKIIGYVLHLRSSDTINKLPNGADDIFKGLQQADLDLKRKPSKCAGSINEILTSHWAKNWGAPYKYRVAQESTAFKDAPDVIIMALKMLTAAGQEGVALVGDEFGSFREFNEMLSVGYFEKSHMGYHDDGEKTLGPTVVSLSLGCSSTMHWRPKAKSNIGDESTNQRGTKKDVLIIELGHGDIMIMHGLGIQELYEHSVNPCGKLRFALTCRHINLAEICSKSERNYAEKAGQLPQGSDRFKYDFHGDMQEISAEGALSPKEKTQLFSDKCSSDENSASQGLSQDNESNGMQILHPSPQAEEATTQLSAVAQSAGGNEQKKNFVNELAPSSLAQPVGMLSPRSEHQNYERQNYEHQEGEYQELEYPEFEDQLWTPGTYDIFDPLITTEAVGAQARQYQLSDYDNVPSMNQAWGMMQPQAQNYSEGYNEEHNFASSKAQATGMSQHQAQHYSDSDGQRFGLASSMNQATGMSQHQVQQYYDNGYEDAPSQANGTIQHHAQLPYEHDYGHSSVVEEPTPSIYPLEDLEKTQNEAFEHYNDGN